MGRLSKSAARKVFSITFRLMFIETLYTIAYFDIFRLHFIEKCLFVWVFDIFRPNSYRNERAGARFR